MSTTIVLKNSVTTTNTPSSLAQGEVAINITDKKMWVGNAATTPIQIVSNDPNGIFTSVTDSGLTNTRVTYAGAGGLLKDSASITTDGTTITAGGFSGPLNGTVGATTPADGKFTTLSASSNVSVSGILTSLTAASGTNTTQVATTAFAYGAFGIGGNGYVKLSNGLIIQWGTNVGTSPITITLPITYPNTLFATPIVTNGDINASSAICGTSSYSNSQIILGTNSGGSFRYSWITFGY